MENYRVTLKAKAFNWNQETGKYDKLEAPIEFTLARAEEVGRFVGELTYAAEEPLYIEIKREEV